MADNVPITSGSGISIAADDISSVLYQRVKIIIGADGTNNGDVASGNPMPVTGSTTVIGTVTITGSTSIVGTVTVTGSTSVANTVTITGNTTVLGTVTITGSTAVVNTVTVTGSTAIVGTVTITGSTTILNPTGAGTGGIRVVDANDAGKTLSVTSGTLSATNGTLVVSVSGQKIKVYAISLTTTSSTQQLVKFQTAVGGIDLWTVALIAPTGAVAQANLSVNPPSYLFATGTTNVLNLSLTNANAVHYAVSYFTEA